MIFFERMLFSKYILERKMFSDNSIRLSWEKSTLREWLKNEYISDAFSSGEEKIIISSSVSNNGKDTLDKVFLISADEGSKYLSDSMWQAKEIEGTQREWWLRTLEENNMIPCVTEHGDIRERAAYHTFGVRPAMWIDVSNL